MAKLPLLVVSVVYFCVSVVCGQQPVVNPPNDQFVALGSPDNVTYTCTVPSPRAVIWEVQRSQIRSAFQFGDVASIGITIDPPVTNSSSSTVTISQLARDTLNNSDISILCLSIEGISTIDGETYSVVSVSPPAAPGNLILVPSNPTLTLEWNRPTNVPVPVQVTYIVDINSTDPNIDMNFRNLTTETFLSVHFLEVLLARGQCLMFEFSVTGQNFAGVGETATIIDTVPISPDVTNITRDKTVETFDLQPLQVRVSFPPVIPCSSNFPLSNYTLEINGELARFFTPSEVPLTNGLVVLVLSSSRSELPGVIQDGFYSLTVTACNDVTCKTSAPRTFFTTDVQRAEAIFFENRLFLRCTFAANSMDRGCAFVLTLSGTNETERFELGIVSGGSNSVCTMANNQKDAYRSVEAFDIEMDGSDGDVRLDITQTAVVLTTEAEFIDMTGCRLPTDNTAAIVGGVIGALLFLVIVIVVTVVVVIGVCYYGWCGWIEVEDLDDFLIKKKDIKDAARDVTPAAFAVAAAAPPPPMESRGLHDDEEKDSSPAPHQPLTPPEPVKRQASKKQKTFAQKVKDNKYLLVKTRHLNQVVERLLTETNEPNEQETSS